MTTTISKSYAGIVAAAWEEILVTTPDPFRTSLFNTWSYREQIDAPGINFAGHVIPRIWRVRHNLRRLGNIRLDPARLV